jgi:carboxypeptidase Taq
MSYEELLDEVRKLGNLSQVSEFLEWDEEVMMPEEGRKPRARQKSTISSLRHDILVSDRLGELLESARHEVDDSGDKKAVIREIERKRRRALKVPSDLVSDLSEKSSESVEAWKTARQEDDFESFAPHLRELVELKREYANHIDPDEEPYRVLFREFEPYLSYERMEEIIENLKHGIQEILDDIEQSDRALNSDALSGNFSREEQLEIGRRVAEALGYDLDRGRIDFSSHPFTAGNASDARITTWHRPEDLAESIMPSIHEAGHALYQQGLPEEHYATPLGTSRELSIHESQSRLWENHVGRLREFWNFFLPRIAQVVDIDASPEEAYERVNRVYPDNVVRGEADELTYHLHIVVRFETGRDLINGEIEVEELPQVWNDRMEEYLGVRPENDSEGVLQDIHWADGNFGYFPTYSLGTVISAQLFRSARHEIPDLDEKIENGEFEPLLDWLRENVHRHGQRYRTEELVERATGEKPKADYFLEYAREKYSDLYDL